jgi:hypothetical protein
MYGLSDDAISAPSNQFLTLFYPTPTIMVHITASQRGTLIFVHNLRYAYSSPFGHINTQPLTLNGFYATLPTTKAATPSSSLRTSIFIVTPVFALNAIRTMAATFPPVIVLP